MKDLALIVGFKSLLMNWWDDWNEWVDKINNDVVMKIHLAHDTVKVAQVLKQKKLKSLFSIRAHREIREQERYVVLTTQESYEEHVIKKF